MDAIFEKMKKAGHTDVESLIKWMKDSKVIDSKFAEDQARALLNNVADKKNVELDKFKKTLGKLANDQKKKVTNFAKSMAKSAFAKLLGSTKQENTLAEDIEDDDVDDLGTSTAGSSGSLQATTTSNDDDTQAATTSNDDDTQATTTSVDDTATAPSDSSARDS